MRTKLFITLSILLISAMGSSAFAQGKSGGGSSNQIYKKKNQQQVQEQAQEKIENKYTKQKKEYYQNKQQEKNQIQSRDRYEKNIQVWNSKNKCWMENGECINTMYQRNINNRVRESYRFND